MTFLLCTLVGAMTIGVAGTALAGPSCDVMNGPTPYSDLQAAFDAAALGDTLTVSGLCWGPFTVGQNVTVAGSGISTATLTASPGAPVLTVSNGATFIGTAFTLSGGQGGDGTAGAVGTPGANGADGQPGGILNHGQTDLLGVLISGNTGGNGGNGDLEVGSEGDGGMGGAGGIES
ncbi:MAG: hypothetical protein QOE25_241, partial [Actinomycetota bacterium]|nr:hypothetical protein [Actinomycetota bacterium]